MDGGARGRRRAWLVLRRRSLAAAGLGVLGFALLGWACSLYLDPVLEPAPGDGGIEANSADAGGDSGDAEASAPTECTVDRDCPTINACVVSRCEPKTRRCRFDVCPAATCGFKRCDEGFVCARNEAPLAFKSHTFTVPGAVSCDRPALCLALAYPFLYAALEGGAVAIDMTAIGTPTPALIGVEGVDFAPATIVASGRYVYIVGRPFLAATPGVRVAWIDAPRHPFVTKLVAASTPSNFADPSPLDFRVLAAPDDAIDVGVVPANGLTQYWARLRAPVSASNAFVILGPTSGGGGAPRIPVAASGERALVSAANDYFFLVRRPGLDTVAFGSATLRPAGEPSAPIGSSFAQDEEGRVVWTSATLEGASIRRARLSWLLTGDTALLDGGLPGVDLATFDGGLGAGDLVTAPGAIVDSASAMGLTLDVDTGGTTVQLTRRDGGVVTRVPGRSATLATPPAAIVASFAARGKAYVVEQIAATADDPASLAIHVFSPSCD